MIPTIISAHLEPTGIVLLRWNTTGITIAGNINDPLNVPLGVTVDFSHTFYVADHYANRIQKYLINAANGTTVAGQANTITGASANQLSTPSRIIVDSNGDLFITDTGNARVQLWRNGALAGTTVAGIGMYRSNPSRHLTVHIISICVFIFIDLDF
jgi:sugar lactone lactonase YvrE